jgi:hypothetical protein
MRKLKLWDFYSRNDVHGIFSSHTKFTPQAGTWGLQGIVRVPSRDGDFVFFVTLGQSQGDYFFDESITSDGVLSWQSQPSQDFESDVIKTLIGHDERINNIHLFLRGKKGVDYGYFGRLGYLTHDTQRAKPVHFQWQLMDWEAPREFLESVGVAPISDSFPKNVPEKEPAVDRIDFLSPPKPRNRRTGISTVGFQTIKSPNYVLRQERNSALGLLGEELVLRQEIESLRLAGRDDLAEQVVHVSVVEGDGAGYDIKSFTNDGVEKFIEVKTTKGTATAAFFISPNEIEFSRRNSSRFFLYRLYEVDASTRSAKAFVLSGDLSLCLDLRPTQFIAEISSNDDLRPTL